MIRSIAPNHKVTPAESYKEGILAGSADAKDGLVTSNPEYENAGQDTQGMFRMGYNDGVGDYILEYPDLKIPFDDPKELSESDRTKAISGAMIEYGGSFVNALGRALLLADSVNTRKIKEAFPHEWNRYAIFAGIDP